MEEAKQRIFVAEDDDDLRELLRESFASSGYEVAEAVDGQELRRLLEDAHQSGRDPDLVVSDHRMPFATGLEILSWAAEKVPEVPFILFSAFAAAHVRQRALQLGAAAVIEKPVDLRKLKETVRTVLLARARSAPRSD